MLIASFPDWLSQVGSTVPAMGEVLYEWEGKLLLPPLVRTSRGWAQQQPPPCGCGSQSSLQGWTACSCRDDTVGPGHTTWICRECDKRTAVGCLGQRGLGPMESYGCRTR